ncbi:uncharacterized protein TNCV_2566611 [Trichonephila clavipes]|uniref:Uncharacterized protein n=1 Tax=Trichonephila clavipes TaxID=2585209 RepID=A0A8X6WKJ5_TRICX|nr:uncharacterized protein TNCV_2566611 [Trichonephila clavipes]
MTHHTIPPAVEAVSCCKAKAELRRSPRGLHALVPIYCSPVSSCAAPLYGSRRHKAPSEGVTCDWMAADEAVGCKRAFLTMWRSSRRLVCRGRPEPGLRVNDISWIHWSHNAIRAA